MNRQPLYKYLPRQLFTFFLTCAICVTVFGETVAMAQESQTKRFTLQQILHLALTHNPTIKLSKGIIDEKEGERISATAYPNPSFELQLGHGRVLDPTGPSLTERYFTLSQPLEWPGTRAARKQAANAAVDGAQAGLEETRLNLKARVKHTFYDLLLAETRSELALRTLNTMKELGQAVKRRVQAGEAPPFELVKVNVEMLQAQKEVIRSKGRVRALKVVLNTLAAGNLGPIFSIQGDFQASPFDLGETLLIQEAFQQHPKVRKFKKLIEAAAAQHNQEKQARIPNVTLSGSYQRDAGREGFVGGLSIPLPLWNQRQGNIAKALGIQHQAEAYLKQTQNVLRMEITEHIQNSKTAATQIHTFEQGLLKQAKEAVRIAQTSFKFGEASLLEVLDAQRILWHTLQGYAQARYELSVALTELERLVGKEL